MHMTPERMDAAELEKMMSDYREAVSVSSACRTIKLLRHILWQAKEINARPASTVRPTGEVNA